MPVGLTWGNDPENKVNTTNPFPTTETKPNPDLKETVIFVSKELPPQHLGWNGRLNGPADLNTTSCMSCHITAQYPALTSLVPEGAVPDGGVVISLIFSLLLLPSLMRLIFVARERKLIAPPRGQRPRAVETDAPGTATAGAEAA